jgi:hypothetical protein
VFGVQCSGRASVVHSHAKNRGTRNARLRQQTDFAEAMRNARKEEVFGQKEEALQFLPVCENAETKASLPET